MTSIATPANISLFLNEQLNEAQLQYATSIIPHVRAHFPNKIWKKLGEYVGRHFLTDPIDRLTMYNQVRAYVGKVCHHITTLHSL